MIAGMDGRTRKANRVMSPDQAKICLQPKQTRKVQVVYYLSRGGQLEHPHFMELELPYNEELYLRDIMDRLTLLRGKGMPSLFSWSCKRSYKNGYVWNDLSEDDVVCPARGVEYVLKGSELFEGCSEKYQESSGSKPPMVWHANSEGAMMVHSLDYTPLVSAKPPAVPRRSLKIEAAEDLQDKACSNGMPPDVQFAQNSTTPNSRVTTRVEDNGSGGTSEIPSYRSETQKPCDHTQDHNQIQMSETLDRGASNPEEEQEPQKEKQEEKEVDRNSTELSAGDQSPPSPSSASSEAAAHVDNRSSNPQEIPAAQSKRPSKSVRFQEQKSPQTSTFNLVQLISCGSLAVKDHSIQMSPHRVSRLARAVETSGAQFPISRRRNRIFRSNGVNRTLEEELECMSENPRLLEDKEYFSGSIVEAAKAAEDEPDPTLNKCSSYNAERSSESEMVGTTAKNEDHSGDDRAKTKCLPRKKVPKKLPKTETMPATLSKDLVSGTDTQGSGNNGNSGRWVGLYRFSGHPCIGFT